MTRSVGVKRSGAALAALALGVTAAHAAAAQTPRTLADGRSITAASQVENCRPATVVNDTATGLELAFQCTVPAFEAAADTAGTGQVFILGRAGSVSPAAFLTTQATGWWPDFASWPQEQKDNVITRSDKRTASGPAAFLCLHRDNIDALDGDAVCVLDTPGLQVVAIGKSTMALTADNVVDAMVAGVRIR